MTKNKNKQGKSQEGITVKKNENFSEWYTQVLEKAEVTDVRYDVKGFVVVRPWGAMTMENMYSLYEKELQKKDHKPTFFPVVIPEKNFKKESSHVEGFTPEVFWLEKTQGEERLALRPTSETAFYQMYSLWIRSWRDMPLKLYQRANIFRFETKATRPLIRAREFYWIESHNVFSTKEGAENQVKEDIDTTEKVMHQKFGIPFFPLKRPHWDKFAGAEYTVGSDVPMPDGKLIQQPSTHQLGQHFSKAFDIKFKDKDGKEKHPYQTCYGPAISRILASVISMHGDDYGLVLPFCISPTKLVVVPIYNAKNKDKVLKESEKIVSELENEGISAKLDDSEARPGEKFYEWELKGVPFRIEIGERELDEGKVTLFTRDTREKSKTDIKGLTKEIKKLGEKFDERLKKNAEKFVDESIVETNDRIEIEKALEAGKTVKTNFCSVEKAGEECAEVIEKELSAEVRGTLMNSSGKEEKPSGKCPFCDKEANYVVYIGKSY